VLPDPAAAPVAASEPPLSIRPSLGDDTPRALGDSPFVRWLFALVPVPAIAGWVARRPRRKRREPSAAQRLRTMAKSPSSGETSADSAAVRRVFIEAVRNRTGLNEARLTRPGAWSRALRLEGVEENTSADVELFLVEADAASFGAGAPLAATRADALLRRVEREARARRTKAQSKVVATLAAVLMLAAAGSLLARDQQRAREPFAVGAAAYAGADYVRAERFFADAAREAPRATAAWANYGTAGWAAGDTAAAVVGWQRGLRLDPTSEDLRNRLMRVGAPQDVGLARVIALPGRFPAALALFVWVAGWIATARQSWRRRPALILSLVTIVTGGASAVAARAFENRLEGRALVVIADPVPLRALPALGAESGPQPIVGEVAHVDQRAGVWTHVTLGGGRTGWIPTERVAPLGGD
jgi:hypothetical protein